MLQIARAAAPAAAAMIFRIISSVMLDIKYRRLSQSIAHFVFGFGLLILDKSLYDRRKYGDHGNTNDFLHKHRSPFVNKILCIHAVKHKSWHKCGISAKHEKIPMHSGKRRKTWGSKRYFMLLHLYDIYLKCAALSLFATDCNKTINTTKRRQSYAFRL